MIKVDSLTELLEGDETVKHLRTVIAWGMSNMTFEVGAAIFWDLII